MGNARRWLAAAAIVASVPAQATVVLDFEGVGNLAAVNGFYDGGSDSQGHSGTNYGINLSATSLGIIDADAGGTGNIANEPSPSTVLFFLSGGAATVNVAGGFDTGFSFFYSANGVGFVNVFDGLNATGNLIASINLSSQFNNNCSGDPKGEYCNWTAIGVAFAGRAKSIDFGGTANRIAFDDITFGSVTPGVPEPGTYALMGAGLAMVAVAAWRRRQ